MSVNINLKEIFSADSQSDLANKLNFNFNQLIALGVGQPGADGEKGDDGADGPIGSIGLTGAAGTKIYSITAAGLIDLNGDEPAEAVIGDYCVGPTGIYKKISDTTTVWEVVSDFDALFRSIAFDTQPWATGLNTDPPPARIIIPVKSSMGLDRKTQGFGTKPADWYLTYPPNWRLTTDSSQNAQGVMFNFDVYTAKKMEDDLAIGLNGYSVKVSDSRLGTSVAQLNTAFPYSSLLSLYSFFVSSDAATEADQFADSTGYRHQLELGSVDEIPEKLNSADPSANYVISPTYQNLRIRKYRVSASDLPGGSLIAAEFNLHSDDSAKKPALSSKFSWSTNKKEYADQGYSSQLHMALSNLKIEGSTDAVSAHTTGILLDGIHLRMDSATLAESHFLAIGFDLDNFGEDLIFRSDTSNTITNVLFDGLSITAKNAAKSVQLTASGVTAQSDNDLGIYASDTNKEVKIGSSSANVALKIKGDRLNSAVPFPVSTGSLPTANSSDPNTLDEYLEQAFTPTVYFGTLPTPAGSVLLQNAPTISDENGIMTKVGRLVSFTLKFRIKKWAVVTTTGRVSPPYYEDPYSSLTIDVGELNGTEGDWTGMQHEIGSEAYQMMVRGIPDHWPDPAGSENVKFAITLKPITSNGYLLRPFSMTYSWENGGTQTSSTPWSPINPNSIYAKFSYYGNPSTPQLALYGRRANGQLESNLSIYDFLNYVHPSYTSDPYLGNEIEVTISGSYMTSHQTAQEVHPSGVTTTTTTAGPTTTTTTGPTTTTTTGPTTTTTTGPTTTTTTGPPTTTTTTAAPLYGSEMVSNADSDYF